MGCKLGFLKLANIKFFKVHFLLFVTLVAMLGRHCLFSRQKVMNLSFAS